MSFTERKREEIKKYILRKIAEDDTSVIEKTMDNFAISITSVKRYVEQELQLGHIEMSEDAACGYKLITENKSFSFSINKNEVTEDVIFNKYIMGFVEQCNSNAVNIWSYICAEMINNAIEHSRGTEVKVDLFKNYLFTTISITDNGVGLFQTMIEAMSQSGWANHSMEDALVELYKGKFTSNPVAHSGEGIFFASKVADQFIIWSQGTVMKVGGIEPAEVIRSRLLAYYSKFHNLGTAVIMELENDTSRTMLEVFDMYSDLEQGLYKTKIPVKEACISGEPVARSQARRICQRLEDFQEVVLDFSNVEFIGQGFADEIFRVYANGHPEVMLVPYNANINVVKMIRHVTAHKLQYDNVDFGK